MRNEPVRPVAYGYWSERLGWYACSLLPGGTYTQPDLRPLYDKAALDAAVAAERERWQKELAAKDEQIDRILKHSLEQQAYLRSYIR